MKERFATHLSPTERHQVKLRLSYIGDRLIDLDNMERSLRQERSQLRQEQAHLNAQVYRS